MSPSRKPAAAKKTVAKKNVKPASAAAKNLPDYTDLLTADNWIWQECPGEHSFDIWYLGLFNFLRILGN